MEAFKYLMIGKALGPTEVYVEMTLASGDAGISVLMEPCQRILDGMECQKTVRPVLQFLF